MPWLGVAVVGIALDRLPTPAPTEIAIPAVTPAPVASAAIVTAVAAITTAVGATVEVEGITLGGSIREVLPLDMRPGPIIPSKAGPGIVWNKRAYPRGSQPGQALSVGTSWYTNFAAPTVATAARRPPARCIWASVGRNSRAPGSFAEQALHPWERLRGGPQYFAGQVREDIAQVRRDGWALL